MKRFCSFLLAVLLVLGLCACGAQQPAATTAPTEAPASFMAGFGSANVTPSDFGIPMDGYGNTSERLSTSVMSYIFALTVAVQDTEGNTALMVSVDSCAVPENICDEVRSWAEKKLSIPRENILISAIHQHSCPDADAPGYQSELISGIKDSIQAALEDLAPAELYTNRVETNALNAVRRYWLNDGGFVTSHSCTGDKSSGFKAYESEPDREMRLIKFSRPSSKDIILVNFQCHPHMSSGSTKTEICADWPGIMRDEVSKELDVHCIYYSGAGGNMNSSSANKEHNISTDWKHHGQRAAQFVIDAEGTYSKANAGIIRAKEVTNTYEADHRLDHLLSSAMIINETKKKDGISAAKELLKSYPELNSHFQASAVVTKASAGPNKDCTISAITFGDIAFTAHPYEMFDSNGKQLREGTVGNIDYAVEDQLDNPFAMTIVVSKANGGVGYIPSVIAYDHGGYEPDCTRYAKGTGELIVGDMLHLLNELYE